MVDKRAKHQVCSKLSIPASFVSSVPDVLGGDKLMAVKEAISLKIQEVGQITNIGGQLNIFSQNGSSNANAPQMMINTSGPVADGGDDSEPMSDRIPPPKI